MAVIISTTGKTTLRTGPEQESHTLYQLLQWTKEQPDIKEQTGIASSSPCYFRHQRKVLFDLGMQVRALPPGSKLELVGPDALGPRELMELKGLREATVKVSIEADGKRFVAQVKAKSSLWQLLHSIPEFNTVLMTEDGSRLYLPVITVYNCTLELRGLERLRGTSLFDLGLKGSVLLRVRHEPDHSVSPSDALGPVQSVAIPTTISISPSSSVAVSEMASVVSEAIDYDMDLLVLEPSSTPAPDAGPMPDDEFYSLTAGELKYFQSTAAHATRQLQDRPLLSRQAQDRAQEQRILSAHPLTRLRFRFPDGVLLERNFRTTDTVQLVLAWLTGFLRKTPELSVGPPVRYLKPHDTLLALHLYPAAIINVLWSDVTSSPNPISTMQLIGMAKGDDQTVRPAAKRVSSPTTINTPMAETAPQAKSAQPPKWLKLHK